jgi:hypothetical protein
MVSIPSAALLTVPVTAKSLVLVVGFLSDENDPAARHRSG